MQWRHRSTGFFTQILVISFRFYKDCSVKHSAKLTSFPQTIFKIFEIFWSVSLLKMEEINLHSKTYLFKVSNKNARKWCEICLKLTIKTPKRRHWHLFGVFVVNFEPISHLFYCLHIVDLSIYLFAGKITSKTCRNLIADLWNLSNFKKIPRNLTIVCYQLRPHTLMNVCMLEAMECSQ